MQNYGLQLHTLARVAQSITELDLEVDALSRANCWNFLASMLRRIDSRQTQFLNFKTAQVGIKRDKSGADPAVTARVGQTSCPDNK